MRGLRQSLQEYASRNPDPQIQQRVSEILSNPHGMLIYLGVTIILLLVLFVALCATGGALGASLAGRRSRP
jgi:hypothetical protein